MILSFLCWQHPPAPGFCSETCRKWKLTPNREGTGTRRGLLAFDTEPQPQRWHKLILYLQRGTGFLIPGNKSGLNHSRTRQGHLKCQEGAGRTEQWRLHALSLCKGPPALQPQCEEPEREVALISAASCHILGMSIVFKELE